MARRPLAYSLLLLALALPGLAQAQDEDPFEFDDLLGEDEEPAPPPPDRVDEPDDLDALDEDEDFQFLDDPDAEQRDDLLDGERQDQFDDTAVLYRRMLERVEGASPEEEVELWEAYLRRYPNSAFKDRIEERVDAILSGLYGDELDGPGEGPVDALRQEIDFSQGLLLENLNPRTNLQAGLEWGLPDWGNLYAGYEHQLARPFSVYGRLGRRFTGWGVEAGARYAIIKSLRTNTLLTASGTVHLNGNPTFLGLRPMIGFGKRFGEVLDVQVQLGGELEITGPVGFRVMGGGNVTWRAADTVAVFGETTIQAKNLTWKEGRTFNFSVLSFGMKFMPTPGDLKPGQLQLNVGATVPYASWYWMYHFGAIMAQINYYPESPDRR